MLMQEEEKWKSAFKHTQNVQIQIKFADVQSIILAFALHLYILQYPIILLVDSEGPD